MYDTVRVRVKVLEKRETGVFCERDGRTFEIPLESLWDEGDEIVVGNTCELDVFRRWARNNGLVHE
jgi:hypothetical protein